MPTQWEAEPVCAPHRAVRVRCARAARPRSARAHQAPTPRPTGASDVRGAGNHGKKIAVVENEFGEVGSKPRLHGAPLTVGGVRLPPAALAPDPCAHRL
jgi:hypothetical protein